MAPEDWAAVAATRAAIPPLPAEAAVLVAEWGEAGWPMIARRAMPGDATGAMPVGLPLPPTVGKARVALTIAQGLRYRRTPAMALKIARASAPPAWQATLDLVARLGAALGVVPCVYGALLWQALTDLPYLHAASDLDLLWRLGDGSQLDDLLDGLADIDATAPMRLDGEIATPRGGVAWRELAAARRGEVDIVLVKSLARTGMIAAAELFADAPCP